MDKVALSVGWSVMPVAVTVVFMILVMGLTVNHSSHKWRSAIMIMAEAVQCFGTDGPYGGCG